MKRLLLTISLLFPSALAQTDTAVPTDPAGTTATDAGLGEAGNNQTGRDQDFDWGLLGLLGLVGLAGLNRRHTPAPTGPHR